MLPASYKTRPSDPTDFYWTARLCPHLAYSGYRHQAGQGFVFNSARYKLQIEGGLRQGRSCKDAHAPDITDIASHGQGNIKAPVGPPSGWDEAVPVFCSQDGTRLKRASWSHRIGEYPKRLGERIRAYNLRNG